MLLYNVPGTSGAVRIVRSYCHDRLSDASFENCLPEPWMEDVVDLRRCVIAGRVLFHDLPGVVRDLLTIWECIRSFFWYTGSRRIKDETDGVIFVDFVSIWYDIFICRLKVIVVF